MLKTLDNSHVEFVEMIKKSHLENKEELLAKFSDNYSNTLYQLGMDTTMRKAEKTNDPWAKGLKITLREELDNIDI